MTRLSQTTDHDHDLHGRNRHGHEHHDHHRLSLSDSVGTTFIIAILLNLIFVAIEAAVGFTHHSLGLLSDAGHNLGDVFSLILALIAFRLAKVRSNRKYTYGYKKSTVLISLTNALILFVAVGMILLESLRKLQHPAPVDGIAVTWTAAVGILINGATAWMLMKGQKGDLNVRGAFLHMLSDTLVSVGVVISGIIIHFSGLTVIDPIIGIAISLIILWSTWHLFRESLKLSLDGVPDSIDREQVREALLASPHVQDVHHLHIWAISTTQTALTAHLVLDRMDAADEAKALAKEKLQSLGIHHSTLETETAASPCCDPACN